ncbi:hypothetical protein TKK_0003444 [Trichogramma kaykai]|uniref:Uncharacterized protein n=1 Tax=Trichogramma kaykai TaxID=54128 RepID=A0ABD2XQY6_9HYME
MNDMLDYIASQQEIESNPSSLRDITNFPDAISKNKNKCSMNKKTLNWIYLTQLKTLMNLSLMIWDFYKNMFLKKQKLKVTKEIKLKQLVF